VVDMVECRADLPVEYRASPGGLTLSHFSNLPFDGCDGLRLNRNVAAQPA
jgi:hypothetical protein